MELEDIRATLKELERDTYDNISHSITKALRIAQSRLDIEELLMLRLVKEKVGKEKNKLVFEQVKKLAVRKGFSEDEFKELYSKAIDKLRELRSCDWYDEQEGKLLKGRLVILPLSELIVDLKHHESLLEGNSIPDGLAPLDAYVENQNRKKMDNALYNHIINYKLILNRVKDYLVDYLVKVESEMMLDKENEGLDTKHKLQLLIEEGFEVKEKCFNPDTESGLYDHIYGSEYVAWIQSAKMFLKNNVEDREVYNDFLKVAEHANGNGVDHFDNMIGILQSLLSYDFSKAESKETSISKIFISHSSKDLDYVRPLVDLLNDIGIKKSDKHIFCSSLAGYDIPYNQNIYEFLKDELNRENVMVLFVLSDNYYSSAPCLNEMGAAWITSKESGFILTPNFDFSKVDGAIDSTKISLKMDDVKGLDKFKDSIVETFELEDVGYKIWQEDRDKFVKQIHDKATVEGKEMVAKVLVEKVKKLSQDKLEIQLRFINSTDRDLEFKYIDIDLFDEKGTKISLNADEYLDDFWLYSHENKIVKWTFKNEENYNPRRAKSEDSNVVYEIQ
ncbi:toll/interleukin-1 receptor domain-containing protein [Halobacillus halophilus]|uniref:toll/interleukin-1 receptor domain-containing protein n=1 Tax=Halobacillus halophilus TaxID=1570 RepID=UPI001CD2F4AB|nr:toll/interleukin-1 receptor domain-containing protein [Halobacillus halophilus]MCA1011461.1 toll/interleukin-1 receptor domain-containing protein [Halobacillus halophilus]